MAAASHVGGFAPKPPADGGRRGPNPICAPELRSLLCYRRLHHDGPRAAFASPLKRHTDHLLASQKRWLGAVKSVPGPRKSRRGEERCRSLAFVVAVAARRRRSPSPSPSLSPVAFGPIAFAFAFAFGRLAFAFGRLAYGPQATSFSQASRSDGSMRGTIPRI